MTKTKKEERLFKYLLNLVFYHFVVIVHFFGPDLVWHILQSKCRCLSLQLIDLKGHSKNTKHFFWPILDPPSPCGMAFGNTGADWGPLHTHTHTHTRDWGIVNFMPKIKFLPPKTAKIQKNTHVCWGCTIWPRYCRSLLQLS